MKMRYKVTMTMDNIIKTLDELDGFDMPLFDYSYSDIVKEVVPLLKFYEAHKGDDLRHQMKLFKRKMRSENKKNLSIVVDDLVWTLVRMCDFTFDVVQFKGHYVYSFNFRSAGNKFEIVRSTKLGRFVDWFHTFSDEGRSWFVGSHIIKALLEHYPITIADSVFEADDKTVKSEAIELFAKGIDAQAGKGAFAAYLLYPKLYDEASFGPKRTLVAGFRSMTGKSMLIKLAESLYGSLTLRIGVLPTGTSVRSRVGWNGYMENSVICFCDMDDGRSSQADFYQTVHKPNGLQLTTKRNGVAACTQFKGYLYVNVNGFDFYFKKRAVQDCLYFFHLMMPVDDYMPKEYVNELNGYRITSNIDALINYLNAHEEDARAWLSNYETPDILKSKKCSWSDGSVIRYYRSDDDCLTEEKRVAAILEKWND